MLKQRGRTSIYWRDRPWPHPVRPPSLEIPPLNRSTSRASWPDFPGLYSYPPSRLTPFPAACKIRALSAVNRWDSHH